MTSRRSRSIAPRTALEKGRIRQDREGGRPSEDDIAKAELGQQGVPGKPDKPEVLEQDEMQNPKPLDQGHTS